jgi:uncharacterized protein YvpB
MRRRSSVSVLAVFAVLAAVAPSKANDVGASAVLQIDAGPVHLVVPAGERAAWAGPRGEAWQRAAGWLRARSTARGAGIGARLSWRAGLVRRVVAAAASGRGSISIPQAVSRVELAAPLVRQRYRNGCEAAALSIALRVAAGQDRLQRALPQAAPLVARETSRGLVWGDPQLGFVGDVESGGYGVYDRPLLAVARQRDRGAENLTGRPLATMLAALRDGHPIVAWVTLGASRPIAWHTRSGAVVHADRAEHAITLTGWRRHLIDYVDPWDGRLKTFAVADLALRWLPLGRRALALSARRARAG